jgi:microcystin degradation protein MlrC
MKIIPAATMPFGSSRASMGDSVWVRAAGEIDLVLTGNREQTFHPEAFTQFGISLTDKTFVCVKSLQHFYAGFSELTENIVYLAVPGSLNMDFATIVYEKMTDPYWPRVENPFNS